MGSPDREGGNPVTAMDGFQDFGEVLERDVKDGKAGFVVLVNNELHIDGNGLVVTFLKEEGDRPEWFEFDLPRSPARAKRGGRLQVVKVVWVDEGARVVSFTAFLDDRADHVPVSRSLVPQSPESMKSLAELDEVRVDVGGVGGSEGEADPRGSST